MQTIENFKKVALLLFIFLGTLHLTTNIFIANDLWVEKSYIINRILDIPFMLTGLIYALASLRLSLTDPDKRHKGLDILFIIIIMVTLIGLMAINLFVPTLETVQ